MDWACPDEEILRSPLAEPDQISKPTRDEARVAQRIPQLTMSQDRPGRTRMGHGREPLGDYLPRPRWTRRCHEDQFNRPEPGGHIRGGRLGLES
jgi:hypothetical protein